MLAIEFKGSTQLVQKIGRMSGAVKKALIVEITKLSLELQNYVVQEKLSGQVLNHITGNLWSSIHTMEVVDEGDAVVGGVFASKDVPYAAIHEFGGTIKHPGGTPYMILDNGLARFVSKESELAERLPVTKPHDIPMPERSYLRSSLKDNTNKIREGIVEAVREAMKEGLE